MGGPTLPNFDQTHVTQALVHTLLDTFDAAHDLHQTLRSVEKRELERDLRSRGYPQSRRVELVDDDEEKGEVSLNMDKAAVTQQFKVGAEQMGEQFAIGDVATETGLQSQIIALQSAVIDIFLYGPTSTEPITDQLSRLVAASRSAGMATVDILSAQQNKLASAPSIESPPTVMPSSKRPVSTHPRTTQGELDHLPEHVITQPRRESTTRSLVSPDRRSSHTSTLPAPTHVLEPVDGRSRRGSVARSIILPDYDSPTVPQTTKAQSRRGSVAHSTVPPDSRSRTATQPQSSASTAIVRSHHSGHPVENTHHTHPAKSTNDSASSAVERSKRSRREDDRTSILHPAKSLALSRPSMPRTDTESTAFSGPTSYDSQSNPRTSYCLYAFELQKHPSQTLAQSITSTGSPSCPHCKRELHLQPGKAWEVFKDDGNRERCYRIQNRFVVKCHRDSVDCGYCCVLCSRSGSNETICGDVRALIKHIWMDHSIRELESEEDIFSVSEDSSEDRRRDSGVGSVSKRSVSLGPSRNGGERHRYSRDTEGSEQRISRRRSRDG